MIRGIALLLLSTSLSVVAQSTPHSSLLHATRSSPGDLEVGGDLTGLPTGSIRYVAYEDLLRLPQQTFTVSDDANFHSPTQISGIALSELRGIFGASTRSDLIVAICYDKYRSNYPTSYLSAHHPILVLKINGQLRDKWPRSYHGGPLGPYLISQPKFIPSFRVLSHSDEAQIPFGVIRIDLRTESSVLGSIRPPGTWPADSPVLQGYRIARQNCFRCHNLEAEGGHMANRSWYQIAAWAAADPDNFKRYVRNPLSVIPCSLMPPQPQYDDRTLSALAAYYKTFLVLRTAK
jgi:hypothetical protein